MFLRFSGRFGSIVFSEASSVLSDTSIVISDIVSSVALKGNLDCGMEVCMYLLALEGKEKGDAPT